MKKRIISAFILSVMALSMTACGDKTNDESTAENVSETTVSADESTETSETKAEKQISATEISESETSSADTEKKESETSAAESKTETEKETEKADDSQEEDAPNNNNNDDNNNDNNNNNNDNAGGNSDNNSSQNNDNSQQETISNDEQPSSSAEFTKNDLIFRYNGNEIYLDENINDVKSKLGEPNDTIVAPSCYYDGDDKTFVYNGFSINTYPDGENDYVVSITITEAGISTEKGAEVGMSINDVLAIYGDSYSQSGSNYQYQIDDKYIYFYVEGDTVQEIGFVYAN